ncbi:hypothetical protein CRG98_041887 [Punica granatum]|uniref:Uncharacterized protein n=1 Tax=Punica granatum TaxID=22663 RepID=A0A2I0I2Q4_PUNGR|nr:hypothetical protein CRG98_041887 [Punica granatum]
MVKEELGTVVGSPNLLPHSNLQICSEGERRIKFGDGLKPAATRGVHGYRVYPESVGTYPNGFRVGSGSMIQQNRVRFQNLETCPLQGRVPIGSSLCRPKWKFYMVSERVMLPHAHVGSHHAIFSFEAAKSAPHIGSSLCRPKWKFYMVSERVMLPHAHVGSHHAIFSFEAAKSAPHVNRAKEWPDPISR